MSRVRSIYVVTVLVINERLRIRRYQIEDRSRSNEL